MPLETLNALSPILQTGAVGAMLIMTWRLMVKKDKASYTMIEAQNTERKEMYKNMEELVREVTTALVSKNTTDEKMSTAINKLADQLADLRRLVKEKQ